jgi:hypothetical protein
MASNKRIPTTLRVIRPLKKPLVVATPPQWITSAAQFKKGAFPRFREVKVDDLLKGSKVLRMANAIFEMPFTHQPVKIPPVSPPAHLRWRFAILTGSPFRAPLK